MKNNPETLPLKECPMCGGKPLYYGTDLPMPEYEEYIAMINHTTNCMLRHHHSYITKYVAHLWNNRIQPSVQGVVALNSRVEVEAELTRERNQRKVAEAMLASKGGTIARLEIEGMEMAEGLHKLREANRVLMEAASEYQNSVNSFNTTRKDTNLDVLIVADTKLTAALALASEEV